MLAVVLVTVGAALIVAAPDPWALAGYVLAASGATLWLDRTLPPWWRARRRRGSREDRVDPARFL